MCTGRLKREGAGRMVVMITSTGVYLIVAVVLIVVVAGGVLVGYRKYNRQDQ